MDRYEWDMEQEKIHAPVSLIDLMRMAVDAYRHPQRVVWDKVSEMEAQWRAVGGSTD
jgi:hypothetical protein